MTSTFYIDKLSVQIICPEINYSLIKSTASSAKNLGLPFRILVPKSRDDEELLKTASLGIVKRTSDTITSMMNEAVRSSKSDWNLIVVGGAKFSLNLIKKYSYFVKNDKDILFPVIDRKMYFYNGSINGILMHKSAIKEVGKIPEEMADINNAKLLWASEAIEKGYQFKGIVGAKFL